MDRQDGGIKMFSHSEETDLRDIAIYTRVSTDEQAREGLSLDEQRSRLESYFHAMGWSQPLRFFIDEGFSAKNINRPQLKALIEAVKDNQISKVIVTKLDRFSRKLQDLLIMIELFQSHGVSFISISESFDTNTPSGRLTLQVLGAVAEFERERIRERVIDNMFHAAKKGQWLTQPPFGYKLIEKLLVINEDEAKIVRRIYDLFLNHNLGFYAIAKLLNEEGIPSSTGKEWWNRTIKLLLVNPAYKGTTVWNRKNGSSPKREDKDIEKWIIQEDTHEPIIDQDTWDKVQLKMQERALPARSQRSSYLLSGFLKCGLCGGGMSYDRAGSKDSKYGVYRCSANKNKGSCTGKVYRAKELEQLFKESLFNLSKDFSYTFVPNVKLAKETTTSTSIQQKIYIANKRYKRKVEAYAAGLIELPDLSAEKKNLDDLLTVLEKTVVQDMDPNQIAKKMQTKLKTIVEALDQLPVAEAKQLLKEIVDRIVVRSAEDIEVYLVIK